MTKSGSNSPVKSLSSFQVISLGFAILILTGTLLLMLPCSSRPAGGASFLDALFTATSAACVTGLSVQDTATYWSGFGQAVLLLLIQVGGLGIVTMAAAFSLLSGKKIGLRQRRIMQDAISAPQVGGIVRLTGFILRVTLLFELVGCVLLAPSFCREFGFWRGIWYALFHSVSAFCNAGFDLMGVKSPFSSLTGYADNLPVNLVIMLLIICGGLGFLTWEDIKTHKFHLKRYRMQSKVILSTTVLLLLLPTLYFFFFEFRGEPDATGGQQLLHAAFQSVTTRTAGFNTTDLNQLSGNGKVVTILLMLVGGSPGSTAGGFKTTTLAVLLFSAVSVFRGRSFAACFGRRISVGTVTNAAAILFLYLSLFLTGGVAISLLEGLPTMTCLFESASAIGTVGLSLGITGGLGVISRLILILLMFLGRVGGLTLIFAALLDGRSSLSKLPEEKITVG